MISQICAHHGCSVIRQATAPNGGYSRTGRGPVPVAERDPITGALTRALWSPDLVVI